MVKAPRKKPEGEERKEEDGRSEAAFPKGGQGRLRGTGWQLQRTIQRFSGL